MYGAHDLGTLDLLISDLTPNTHSPMSDLPFSILLPLRFAFGHVGVRFCTIMTSLRFKVWDKIEIRFKLFLVMAVDYGVRSDAISNINLMWIRWLEIFMCPHKKITTAASIAYIINKQRQHTNTFTTYERVH